MKPQETTNYELLGNDWATRAPVAQTLQTVRQTCPRTTATCAYMFAGFPFSGKFQINKATQDRALLQYTFELYF